MKRGFGTVRAARIGVWMAMAGCVWVCTALEASVELVRLGYLSDSSRYSKAMGVSRYGTVVVGEVTVGDGFEKEAFHWEDGVMTGLGLLREGDLRSTATAVSANGWVVVGNSSSNTDARPFRWESNAMEELPAAEANDVSENGSVVVGTHYNEDEWVEAFRWEADEVTRLGDLPGGYAFSIAHGVSNDGSIVVGAGYTSSGMEAFRWENNILIGLGTLQSWEGSVAYDISADGQVIVGQSGFTAFRWENDVMGALATLPEGSEFNDTVARGVSGDGSIVVGWSSSDAVSGGKEAVFWYRDKDPVSLNDQLDRNDVDRDGFILTEAWAVSDDGSTAVGVGFDSNTGKSEAFLMRLFGLWGSLEVIDDHVDTGDWLGQLYVGSAPWVWSYKTSGWLYIPEEVAQQGLGWMYVPQ